MPYLLSHILHACGNAPLTDWSADLFLGAQGPDPYYYANIPGGAEFGRSLHEIGPSFVDGPPEPAPHPFRTGYRAHLELDGNLEPIIHRHAPTARSHGALEVALDDWLARRHLGQGLLDLSPWAWFQAADRISLGRWFDRAARERGLSAPLPYAQAVRRMERNLTLLYRFPTWKRCLAGIWRLIGNDYRHLFPRTSNGESRDALAELLAAFYPGDRSPG